MDQEPTSASFAPSRTITLTGLKLVHKAQPHHALELVIVLLYSMVKCTFSEVKTTRITNYATCGSSTSKQIHSFKLNYQKTPTNLLQEVAIVQHYITVKCSSSVEF
jgi:hypothetical protein